MPVVRTDGWSVSRRTVMFSWMGSVPHFFTHGAPLHALHARESSAIKFLGRLYLICSFNDGLIHKSFSCAMERCGLFVIYLR